MKPVSKLRAFTFIYGFMRPYLPAFLLGALLYSSQSVLFPLMDASLAGGVTGAMMNLDYGELWAAGLRSAGILALTVCLVYPGVLLYQFNNLKAIRRMQTKLFRAFINAGVEDRAHSGERLSALNNDVSYAGQLYSGALLMLLLNVFPIVTYSVTLFVMEWRIGAYTLFAGLFSMAGQVLFAKPLAKIASAKLEKIAAATKTLGDVFSGGVVARVFRLEDRLLGLFGRENGELRRLIRKESRVNGAQALFSGLSGLLTIGGVFAVGSLLISRGDMTLTELMTVFPLCGAVSAGIRGFGYSWADMQAPLEAGRRIYTLLDGDNRLEPLPRQEKPAFKTGGVTVENLTFAYKNTDKPVLNGVSLTVGENTFAALTGPSGGGKSTLLKVIAGLYKQRNGTVTSGDTAYVDQSCTLFNLTIAENIALGREGASFEEVVAAAKEADADGFISELTDGYQTVVGETGGLLSGGQRQRIAIARALVRRSPVLLFDEPTAALDADSEREVIETISRLRGKHTILMVTHNLPVIKPDAAYRVEDGQISEAV